MNTQDPLTFILFGATGDLAGEKILPAIYNLYKKQLIPADFIFIGNSRTPRTDHSFRKLVKKQLLNHYKKLDTPTWEHFASRLYFSAGDATDEKTIHDLLERVNQLQKQGHECKNLMFHIATLPELYHKIITHLGSKLQYLKSCGWHRLLIEKPFGTDYSTSKQLNNTTLKYFTEEQVFRIDHFLGKETMQNILAFRFANGLFKPIWNKKHIDHIQVTAFETDGVGGREIFYDHTGIIRDYIQNHILQIIATVLMDTPKSLKPKDVRAKRLQVINNLKLAENSHPIFGQYARPIQDQDGYRAYIQEKNVPEDSTTPTFVAFKTYINSTRAKNIPIYIRAGKRLNMKVTEINIQFKDPSKIISKFQSEMSPNILTIRIQPNEGIVIRLNAKKPGHGHNLEPVIMEFCYDSAFSNTPLVEAYERLIADSYHQDHTLFPTAEEVECAWKGIQPLLAQSQQTKPYLYPSLSTGPTHADNLIQADNRQWIEPSPIVCNIKKSN